MNLPIEPRLLPMEAQPARKLPEGESWQYEPKWDGFRCLAMRDGDEVYLQSKAGQPLARYFPDLIVPLLALRAKKFVLDGEIVIPQDGGLSFDSLLQRIHPAESRIRKLSQETPAMLLVFDLLVDGRGTSLIDQPLIKRRQKLEEFAGKFLSDSGIIRLSPATTDLRLARSWLDSLGGSLDGIIAKRTGALYETGERSGAMQKIKNMRTAECVVGGFRYSSKGKVVGSLLLGLYDDDGLLHHCGFTSSMAAADRAEITTKLEKIRKAPGFTGRAPGGPSRWSTERSTEWEPVEPVLVIEVQFDHFSGDRFRHGTKFLRWRPDKAPRQCTFKQVRSESSSPLDLLVRV